MVVHALAQLELRGSTCPRSGHLQHAETPTARVSRASQTCFLLYIGIKLPSNQREGELNTAAVTMIGKLQPLIIC